MLNQTQRNMVLQQQNQLARSLEEIQRRIDHIYPPEQRRRAEEMQRQIDALFPPEHRRSIEDIARQFKCVVPAEVHDNNRKCTEFTASNPAVAKAMAEAAEMMRKLPRRPILSNIPIPD